MKDNPRIKAPSSGELSDTHVLIGVIVKAHGIKGAVKVPPYSGEPEELQTARQVYVEPGPESGRNYSISNWQKQGKYAVLKLESVDNRNEAEALIGKNVWIDKQFLPALAPEEYYWHEMVGLEVFTKAGQRLGKVANLMATGAHDILVVADGEKEYLIPVLEEIITSLDSEQGILTIDPMPGLLEMNDGEKHQ